MVACREVQVLRALSSPPALRRRAIKRIVYKYADGRRTAAHVVDALAASLAQMNRGECSRLLSEALLVVRPVPSLLWDYACGHVESLGSGTVQEMLELVARDARLAKRFRTHRHRTTHSADAFVALLLAQEKHRFDWAVPLIRQFGCTIRREA